MTSYLFRRKSTEDAGYNIQDDFLTYQDMSYSLFRPPSLNIIGTLHMSVLLCCLWFCGMRWQIMCFCLCDTHEKFWCHRDAPLRRCLDCHKHFRVICEADQVHEEEKLQRDFYERIRPLYLWLVCGVHHGEGHRKMAVPAWSLGATKWVNGCQSQLIFGCIHSWGVNTLSQ